MIHKLDIGFKYECACRVACLTVGGASRDACVRDRVSCGNCEFLLWATVILVALLLSNSDSFRCFLEIFMNRYFEFWHGHCVAVWVQCLG